MAHNWWSYDTVAATYDQLAAPHLFAPIAQDLVALLELPAGAVVLDVGTGSGSGALAAFQKTGPQGLVVGFDPALEMLRLVRRKGLRALVAGVVPGLPFPDGVFDGVAANFVVNHVSSFQKALSDMARVLRPGGRLAVSAWGPSQNEYRQVWRELVESAVGKEPLEQALRQAVPGEEWFSDSLRLRTSIAEAGLVNVTLEQHTYTTEMTISDYLSMREISMAGRFAFESLSPAQWELFRATVSKTFHERFREPITDTFPAYLCAGQKP